MEHWITADQNFRSVLLEAIENGVKRIRVDEGLHRVDRTISLPPGVSLRGVGPQSGIASESGLHGPLVLAEGGCEISGLSLVSHAKGPALEVRQHPSRLPRVEISDVWVQQYRQNRPGIQLIPTQGLPWMRVSLRDVRCTYHGPEGIDHHCVGALVSPRDTQCEDLELVGCEFRGWHTGFDTGGNKGGWKNAHVDRCGFVENLSYGARFYHCGDLTVRGSRFDDNDVGAWLDNSSDNFETIFTDCKVRRNRAVGIMTEEWRRGIIASSVLSDNGIGLWMASGHRSIVASCVVTLNRIGIMTQGDLPVRSAQTGHLYRLSHPTTIKGLKLLGVLAVDNVEGYDVFLNDVDGCVLDGCTIGELDIGKSAVNVVVNGGQVSNYGGERAPISDTATRFELAAGP